MPCRRRRGPVRWRRLVHHSKRVALCATRRPPTPCAACSTHARYEVLPTAVRRGGRARAPAARLHRHDHRVAVQGPGGHPRPGRAAGRPRLRRRARTSPRGWSPGASELADICARLVALGVRTIFVPAGDADPPAGDYHAALDLLEDLDRARPPVPERRRHRLSRIAPVDPRRPDRAGDVGQAPARHARRQQPDLRPGDRADLAAPDARARDHHPAARRRARARSTARSC